MDRSGIWTTCNEASFTCNESAGYTGVYAFASIEECEPESFGSADEHHGWYNVYRLHTTVNAKALIHDRLIHDTDS